LFDKYIGIPFVDNGDDFNKCDCFGIVRLFYKEELNISIFKHEGNQHSIKRAVLEFLQESRINWQVVQEPKLYDVIAMAHDPNHPKIIQHFGIYIGDGKMIHTLNKASSHIAKVDDYKYYIKSIHRHKRLLNG